MSLDSKVQAVKRSHRQLSFNDPIRLLGDGSFGSCVLAAYRTSDASEDVAIKISSGGERACKMLRTEGEILESLDHENIIKFLWAGTEKDDTGAPFQFMVLELANNGSLKNWLDRDERPLSRLGIMYEVFLGLDHLHCMEVFHRDIKPENILVHKDSNGKYMIKLADFGLAELEDESYNENGTIIYLPPEMWVVNPPYDNAAADVYTAALLLVQMMSAGNKLPWKDKAGHSTWYHAAEWKTITEHQCILKFFRRSLVEARDRDDTDTLRRRLKKAMILLPDW